MEPKKIEVYYNGTVVAFKNLISKFRSYILALQETYFKDTDNVNIRGFDHYFKTCISEVDGRATGGCSIFV